VATLVPPAEPSGDGPPPVAATGLSRRLLGYEVILVLALSLGASGVYAFLDLLKGLVATKVPLAAQTVVLAAPRDTHVWLDVTYQIVDLATQLAPVLLVAYLLVRSAESMAVIGVDRRQPRRDGLAGAGLALLIGGVGLVALLIGKALGLNRLIEVGGSSTRWWSIALLVASAAGSAISEEVIVGGYLLHRFRQLGWSDNAALLTAAVVRGSYHLYQGWGGAIDNLVLGLFFGRIFQRRGRVMPLLLAHFLVDAVAYVGYVELKGKVSWLP